MIVVGFASSLPDLNALYISLTGLNDSLGNLVDALPNLYVILSILFIIYVSLLSDNYHKKRANICGVSVATHTTAPNLIQLGSTNLF